MELDHYNPNSAKCIGTVLLRIYYNLNFYHFLMKFSSLMVKLNANSQINSTKISFLFQTQPKHLIIEEASNDGIVFGITR